MTTNDDHDALERAIMDACVGARFRPRTIAAELIAAGFRRVPDAPTPLNDDWLKRADEPLTDHDWLQLTQAAHGCTSGITDWPHLRFAIAKIVRQRRAPTPPEAETNPPGVDLYCVARKCVLDGVIFGKGATFAEAIADMKEHESRALEFESDDPIADWRDLPTSAAAPTRAQWASADMMVAAGYPTPQSVVDNLTAQRDAAEYKLVIAHTAVTELTRERDTWKDRVLREQKITEDMRVERDEAWSLYASTREKQHEVELALIAQRDAAVADAAALRAILTEIMGSNGRVTVGMLRSINDIIAAAPAAKETT